MAVDGRPARGGRVLVVTPTYNEIESLDRTVTALLAAVPSAELLIVDDSSPDGTGELADRLAAADERVHVLHRTTKDGLGRAYLAGFAWGAEHGFSILVEMDADGSHPPESLPAMLEALAADPATGVVIGSRWVPGGSFRDWPLHRRQLSRAGNAYARWVLGVKVGDLTAGYRAYRAETLADLHTDDVVSRGYCFQIDMSIRTLDAGWRIVEVPIEFRERVSGSSKMTAGIVFEAMTRTTWWGITRRLGLRRPHPRRSVEERGGA